MSTGRILLASWVAILGWVSVARAEPPVQDIFIPCFHSPIVDTTLLAGTRRTAPVNLFAAQQAGQLQIRYQPRNERSAHVQIRNLSNQALTVQLPDVFAARPVLAQFNPFQRGANNNSGSNNAQQAVGGPFNLGNNRNGGNSNQRVPNIFNQFNIAPEGLVQFDVQSVCLEQGQPTPTPGSRYEMLPIDELLSEPTVIRDVLIELRDQKISHKVAQAAAWHASELSGHMSWKKLTELKGELTMIGRHPYFAPNELKQARELVEKLELAKAKEAEKKYEPSSKGK
jgi:hypothetical protein